MKKLLALSVVAFSTSLAVHAERMTRQEYNDFRGWDLPENEHGCDIGYLFEDRAGQKNTEKYHGFVRWLPEGEFQRKYKQNGHLSFGVALEALKQGHKVCRSGWNGKGMWLSISRLEPFTIPAENFWSPHNRQFAEQNGGQATVLPSITMKTATNEVLMGWLASQTDMLAEDWLIID